MRAYRLMYGTKREKPDWDPGLGQIEVCEVVKLTFMHNKKCLYPAYAARTPSLHAEKCISCKERAILIWCRGYHSCNNNFAHFIISLWPGEKKAAVRESGSVAHLGTIVAQLRRKQLIELIKTVINRKE